MSDCGRLCISTSLSLSRVSGTDPEVARRLWNRSLPAPRISGNGLEGSPFGKKAMGFALARLQAQRGQTAGQNPHEEQTRSVN